MNCERRLWRFRWKRHDWQRRVVSAEEVRMAATDQWGRAVAESQTLCHIEYSCARCGAVKSGGACGCELAEGAVCPARLEWIERQSKTQVT